MGSLLAIDSGLEKQARFAHSREQFRHRFGHDFDPQGYHGHPFYGYNCSACGIHISLARPERALLSEKLGKFPGLALPEFAGLRRGRK